MAYISSFPYVIIMLMIKFWEYNNHPSYSNKIKHILKYSFIPQVVYNVRRNDCENKF